MGFHDKYAWLQNPNHVTDNLTEARSRRVTLRKFKPPLFTDCQQPDMSVMLSEVN